MRAGVAGLQAVLGQRGMSAGVLKAGNGPVNISRPLIDNLLPEQGETLFGFPGLWSGTPTGYSFKWVVGSTVRSTAEIYLVQVSDVGFPIKLKTVAHSALGDSAEVTSLVTANVVSSSVSPIKLVGDVATGTLNGPCTAQPDSSGTTNNATQTDSSKQGTISNTGFNGHLSIAYNGTSDVYNLDTPFYPGDNWVSFFVTQKTAAGDAMISLGGPSTNTPLSFGFGSDGNVYVTSQSQYNSGTPDDDTNLNIWTTIEVNGVLYLFKGGSAVPLVLNSFSTANLWSVIGLSQGTYSNGKHAWLDVYGLVPAQQVINNRGQFLAAFFDAPWTDLSVGAYLPKYIAGSASVIFDGNASITGIQLDIGNPCAAVRFTAAGTVILTNMLVRAGTYKLLADGVEIRSQTFFADAIQTVSWNTVDAGSHNYDLVFLYFGADTFFYAQVDDGTGHDGMQSPPLVRNQVWYLGDSITFGSVAENSEGFAYLVSLSLGEGCFNNGVPGRTTGQLNTFLSTATLPENTDRIIVLIGVNDADSGDNGSGSATAYAAIIARLQTLAPTLPKYFLGILPFQTGTYTNRTSFNTMISSSVTAALDATCNYINTDGWIMVNTPDFSPTTPTNLHPSALGHAKVATQLEAAL